MNDVINNSLGFEPVNVLKAALDVCEYMLECGGETHRIEDTAERICRAYGAEMVEIFAIPSLITATIVMPDGSSASQVRRVYENNNNFAKIEKLNSLSRKICITLPSPLSVEKEVMRLRKEKSVFKWMFVLGPMLACGGFAIFFGGNWVEAIIAALVGLLVQIISSKRPSYLNPIAYTVLISLGAGTLISLICKLPIPAQVAAINIGVIMLLIPGLAISNAIRDLICGEVVAGIVKTVQCLLTAGAIAVGFALALLLFKENGSAPTYSVNPILMVVVAGIATVGFSMIFGSRPRWLVYEWIFGMLSISVYLFLIHLCGNEEFMSLFVASFGGGIFCTLSAEILARVNKAPTPVFLYPSLIPLVPGGALYYAVAFLVSGNRKVSYRKGTETLYICLGIAAGIVVVSVLWQIFEHLNARIKRKIKSKTINKKTP